jgi:hypothetical protein
MRYWLSLLGGLAAATLAAAADPGALAPPIKLPAGGKPIDVDIGHAAPFHADFDGDGARDLLVGQFGDGKLRVYRNVGTDSEPRFDKFDWFRAGANPGKVPSG